MPQRQTLSVPGPHGDADRANLDAVENDAVVVVGHGMDDAAEMEGRFGRR